MTWDQWLMLQRDNVVAPGAEGFAAFGIAPTPLAALAPAGWSPIAATAASPRRPIRPPEPLHPAAAALTAARCAAVHAS